MPSHSPTSSSFYDSIISYNIMTITMIFVTNSTILKFNTIQLETGLRH